MARSDGWRINKSAVLPVEGAQALRALTKAAGAAGLPKDFKVRFDSVGIGAYIDFDKKEVHIGGANLFKEAPIPAENFDVLVGLTLHETGHYQVSTDSVFRGALGCVAIEEQSEFKKFINIGEDIIVEAVLSRNPALTDYADALLSWAISQSTGVEAKSHKLLELWVEYGLLHKTDKLFNVMPELVDAVRLLVALTGWLRGSTDINVGDRVGSYVDYWEKIKHLVLNPPEPIKQPKPEKKDLEKIKLEEKNADSNDEWADWGEDSEQDSNGESIDTPEDKEDGEPKSDDGDSEDSENEEEISEESEVEEEELDEGDLEAPLSNNPGGTISQELADAIEEAIQSDSEDVTNEVLDAFRKQSGKREDSCPIIRKRETVQPLISPNQYLCKKLSRILTIRKRLQSRILHGEQYGRIDKRHLSRVNTDKRVFSLKYKFPDGFPNTKILLDLSGSMTGKQADEVLQAAGALQTLVNAEVWCYDQSNNAVNLVRVDDGKTIRKYQPGGITPSGLAIVGVSLGMKRNGLIIHLTDGGQNYGQAPWNANWILKDRGIELVNLIWGKNIQQYDYKGMNWRQLNSLADFPDALYGILIEQAKLGNIGGN